MDEGRTATTISLSWSNGDGYYDGYDLVYSTEGADDVSLAFESDETDVTLTDLTPDTEYVFSLTSRAGGTDQKFSDPVELVLATSKLLYHLT